MSSVSSITPDPALGEKARRSALWNAGLVSLISIGQFGLMLVLVRLLDPEVYGQYGLLLGIIGLVYVFSAQSFAEQMLQVRRDDDVHMQDIFTASVVFNVGLCLLTNIVALLMRDASQYSQIAAPLHWLSLSLLLQPGRAVLTATLKRAFDWRKIRLLHAAGFVLSAVIAIPVAYRGGGIYALLVPHFVVPLPFLYELFVSARWRPSWSWSYANFKPALLFGINRQLSGAIVATRRLVEGALVVQTLGFASLGLLGRAVGLADMLCTRFLGVSMDCCCEQRPGFVLPSPCSPPGWRIHW